VRVTGLIAFVLALTAFGCREELRVVPSSFLGRWICADERYAGRALLISQRAVMFASGPTTSENFMVRGVDSEVLPDGTTTLTITYGNDSADDLSLRLELLATKPPSLQIGHRPERWTLDPTARMLQ
jgi:hypothetical protein